MIEHLWSTPVLHEASPFAADQINELKTFTTERFKTHKAHPTRHAMPDVPVKLRTQLNLFLPDHEMQAPPVWFEFKKWVDMTYRAYLQEAHGVRNASELDVLARCIPVCYQKGMRAQPHYHHTGDHVLCLYLDCGRERSPPENRDWTVGDGELLLQDPRPMAGFPFWEKVRYIETNPGLVVLHPSRIWHETNPFNSPSGERVLLVVTFRVASHNYTELYTRL